MDCIDPTIEPAQVRVLRTLGQGRAARAQLVEVELPDGRTVTCVEKVFAPGLLTRAIYRLSFQSPFAYQSNRDAVLACFYRRRVVAAVLAHSGLDVSIASPLYVRYDTADRAWVLAAEWINGRGVRPAPAQTQRIRTWFLAPRSRSLQLNQPAEIQQLVGTMRQLEAMLVQCGLVGSGWQVAPRAMVSTANLLRAGDRYTIIDLESGIPAVLVPRYLIAGARRAALPPFDDMDPQALRDWIERNGPGLRFQIGPSAVEQLHRDSEKLIEHWTRWKASELALFRRPWRLLTRRGIGSYQQECMRRWRQDGIIDSATEESLPRQPIKSRLIWYAGLMPSAAGRLSSRMIGREDYRRRAAWCLRDPAARAAHWQQIVQRCGRRWSDAGRISSLTRLTGLSFWLHLLAAALTPTGLHRFLCDRRRRRDMATGLLLLLCSPRYQAWFGQNRIKASIDRWENSQRISREEADNLRNNLCGNEVRAYTRGLGMHLALKAFTPLIVPAKVGGVAAFVASGNPWFLLPMLVNPAMRTGITLVNWWTTRHQHIPHGEALAAGWLPVIGSIAFPLQMFSARPDLSTFLVRDAASKLGQRIPVYGGTDSRTEIALIRSTDLVVELMQGMSEVIGRLWPWKHQPVARTHFQLPRQSRFSRWIDRLASQRMAAAEEPIRRADEQPARAA